MRLSSFGLIMLGASGISGICANFHVGRVTKLAGGGYQYHRVCPSPKYGCDCFNGAGDGAKAILPSGTNQLGTYFQVQGGWCKGTSGIPMPVTDFYKRSDGHWDMYKNNGDGAAIGTCYSNSDTKSCGANKYEDNLVCYTTWC
jgi:hypothetical protein